MILLVTGATGIAAAAAELARAHGSTVFTAALSGPADLAVDLTEPGAADEAVRLCVHRYGRLDAVLACAGASGRKWGDGPLHECTDEGWSRTIDVNLTSAFRTCRAAVRRMLEQGGGGAIVLVGSVLALSPKAPEFSTHAYAAAKGGLLSLSRSMAAHYAGDRIRVNYLAPGLTRTPMTERTQADPAAMAFARAKQPLSGGMLEADEVARAAWYLLTAESVTGAVLGVDGGWSVS